MTYPHKTVETLLAEIESINHSGHPKKVLILGAGIAGLTAGYELNRLGHQVQILEAQARVGGRIYTHRFPENPDQLYGEMGAMRLPASHDYPRYYIKKMGLQLRRFVTVFENDNAFLDLRGEVFKIKDAKALIEKLYQITNWEKKHFPQSRILGLRLNEIYGNLTDDQVKQLFQGDLTDPVLQDIANTSLKQLLTSISTGKDAYELIGNLSGEIGMADVSIIKYLRDTIEESDVGLEEIVGGMDLLPVSLAKELGDKIELETEVLAIHSMDDFVKVRIKDKNGQITNIEVDHVICTIPFPVLRRMDLHLKDPSKSFAINTLNYASMTKVILNCRERFWETKYGIFGGASVSDQIIRWTYYPSDHVDENHQQELPDLHIGGISGSSFHTKSLATPSDSTMIGGPGVLLAAYVQGQDAIRIGAGTNEETVQIVKNKISRFHPEILEDDMVTDSFVMDWDAFPWSAGALSYPWPGQSISLFDDIIAPDGNLYFAGEHCATERPWIQGAIRSALESVKAILAKDRS